MGHRTAAADAKTIAGATEQTREDAEEAKEHAVVPVEAEMEKYAEAEKRIENAKKLGEPRRGDGGSDMTREEKADAVTGESMEDAEAAEKSKDVPCRKQPPPAEDMPWPEKKFTTECATAELQQKEQIPKSGLIAHCVHHVQNQLHKTPATPKNSSQFGGPLLFQHAVHKMEVYNQPINNLKKNYFNKFF